ncbi:MAG: hypothetical protein D3916_01075, partial [Candidatus Electrothrix sp. MAN1_4]|nr:hypothetical protein [Candidatus Electrothrix sp. MAN1_4]
MKASLIVPLVSLPFFAACSTVVHKSDPLQGIKQEEIATRSHSAEKAENKEGEQGKIKKSNEESRPVLLQTKGSARLTKKLPGKRHEAALTEKKGSLRQARVIYSSELVPILEPVRKPVMASVDDQEKQAGFAEKKEQPLEPVKRAKRVNQKDVVLTRQNIRQNIWKPRSRGSRKLVSGAITRASGAITRAEHGEKAGFEEAPPLYIPVQSEQELKEELTALEKTGDWSDSGEGKQAILSSYGIQCDLPKSFPPVQLDLERDFLSSLTKGKPSVQPSQKKTSQKFVCDFPIILNKQVEFYL